MAGGAPPRITQSLQSLIWPLSTREFINDVFGNKFYSSHGGDSRLAWLRGKIGDFDVRSLIDFSNSDEIAVSFDNGLESNHRSARVTKKTALQMYDDGATLYFHIDHASIFKQWHEKLCSRLCRPYVGQISVFATRKGGGIRSHFDANHNFTIQLQGKKRWRVAENHCLPNPTQNFVPSCDIHRDLRASTTCPIEHLAPPAALTVDLFPGSVLYLPRGCWHQTEAFCGDSISLNLLFPPLPWVDLLLKQLRAKLLGYEIWRKDADMLFSSNPRKHLATEDLDFLITHLQTCVNSIRATDFGYKKQIKTFMPTNKIRRCELAKWRKLCTKKRRRTITLAIVNSSGIESIETFRLDIFSVFLTIDSIKEPVSLQAILARHPSISYPRLRKLIDGLIVDGLISIE